MLAHPGSGIAVNSHGEVYFQDSAARTIWKIDAKGKLSAFNEKIGGHWMALDTNGRFARSELKLVERISALGASPALIVADGGAPIVLGGDGNLYYGASFSEAGEVEVGLRKIFQDGSHQPFAPQFAQKVKDLGITGIAKAPDGSLYVACLTDIIKVALDGSFKAIASRVVVPNCDPIEPTVFLRGMDVDSGGMIYAAAAGCRCVIRITPQGAIETILKSEPPWSPTGIAVHKDDIYILEYTNASGALGEGWLPRVRKLARDGRATTLASITKEQQQAQPNHQRP